MSKSKTALVAKNMFGEELYRQRAQIALPLLVRQAHAQQYLTYQQLADEMGISNARTLNYVLGSVGVTVQEVAKEWDETIPPIECLIVNKNSKIPGEGFINFLTQRQSKKLSLKEKRLLMHASLTEVYAYPKWLKVLKALKLPAPNATYFDGSGTRLGGESERHKKLKLAIARTPELIGLSKSTSTGKTEYPIPSGDSLDVLFSTRSKWTAVEVKTLISDDKDLVRGLYQCVKYAAVLESWRSVEGSQEDVRVILAIEGKLPAALVGLKNSLGIEVVDDIGPLLSKFGIRLPKK